MKLWGGRFEGKTDDEVEKFSTSIHIDSRLWEVDIIASVAHARMLGETGILPKADVQKIIAGLEDVLGDIRQGRTPIDETAEDIHSDIEVKLTNKIGAVAGKLHTARSRNDQCATDLRLYMRRETESVIKDIRAIQKTLLEISKNHVETVLPGFTHMQHAQPVSLAHHLLAYFWMFERDQSRFCDALKRMNILPLGSAALAGTGFPLDRKMVARELGFSDVSANSLDAVSDRDYIMEFLSAASLSAIHMSRFCEEMILWSTPEFAFIRMSDAVTTGSSIMPQKKNPDVAELVRGKTGRVIGALSASLVLLKGLPLSYNRDLQEDKEILFPGLDTLRACLRMMEIMLRNTEWRKDKMLASLAGDFSNATDLADDLAAKGMPFREAHEVVGRVVSYCEQKGKALEALSLAELKTVNSMFDEATMKVIPHLAVMKARRSEGGTSPEAVLQQIQKAESALK